MTSTINYSIKNLLDYKSGLLNLSSETGENGRHLCCRNVMGSKRCAVRNKGTRKDYGKTYTTMNVFPGTTNASFETYYS